MIKYLLLQLFLLFTIASEAQQNFISKQIPFAEYLLKNSMYEELSTLLQLCNQKNVHNDTLHYYYGKLYYMQNASDSSIYHLKHITTNSAYFFESVPILIYNYSREKKYRDADSLLSVTRKKNVQDSALLTLQQAGLYLLSRDTTSFNHLKLITKNTFHQYEIPYNNICSFKRKSKFMAGALSAVVPGLGKIYGGKPYQGIAAFLTVMLFGSVAGEAYYKGGATHPLFIGSACIFSVFYIGNIWGSVLTVSVRKNEFNSKTNDQILVHMSIPFSKLFK